MWRSLIGLGMRECPTLWLQPLPLIYTARCHTRSLQGDAQGTSQRGRHSQKGRGGQGWTLGTYRLQGPQRVRGQH